MSVILVGNLSGRGKEWKKMRSISVMLKPSSGMCNMKCDYCFYCDETQKRSVESYGFMSEETLKNVIRKTMLNAEESISYTFQGGEPTLRGIDFYRKALEYQQKYNRKGIAAYNAFQTNGLAIDEEWCRFLAENRILTGVSVDGTQAVHDACRHDRQGHPTFDRILRSTELMDEYGVEYNILTVVTGRAAEQIEEIYHFYQRQGWKYQQYIACLDPLGEGHPDRGYAIRPQEYGQFLIRLFDLWYRDLRKNRQPHIRQFENYAGMLLGYPPEACDQRGQCGIMYVTEADGSVYPCDFYMMDEYCLGNFNTNRLAELDAKRKELQFVERSGKLDSECAKCSWYFLCRGGCQRHRDPMENSELYRNYFCEGFRMFFEQCGERLREAAQMMRPHRH